MWVFVLVNSANNCTICIDFTYRFHRKAICSPFNKHLGLRKCLQQLNLSDNMSDTPPCFILWSSYLLDSKSCWFIVHNDKAKWNNYKAGATTEPLIAAKGGNVSIWWRASAILHIMIFFLRQPWGKMKWCLSQYFFKQFTRQLRDLIKSFQQMLHRGFSKAKALFEEHLDDKHRITQAYLDKTISWLNNKWEDFTALQLSQFL